MRWSHLKYLQGDLHVVSLYQTKRQTGPVEATAPMVRSLCCPQDLNRQPLDFQARRVKPTAPPLYTEILSIPGGSMMHDGPNALCAHSKAKVITL